MMRTKIWIWQTIVRKFNLKLTKPKVLPFDFRLSVVLVNFVRNLSEMAGRMFLIEAALREERLERRRRRRRLRNQLNISQIPDVEFVGHYRLNRQLFEELCEDIVPLLPPKARRHGIEPTVKVNIALFLSILFNKNRYLSISLFTIFNIFRFLRPWIFMPELVTKGLWDKTWMAPWLNRLFLVVWRRSQLRWMHPIF